MSRQKQLKMNDKNRRRFNKLISQLAQSGLEYFMKQDTDVAAGASRVVCHMMEDGGGIHYRSELYSLLTEVVRDEMEVLKCQQDL